jgi:hypothetical protein
MCTTRNFVTAWLAILHNYNNFHAHTESGACSRKRNFSHRITNCATKKNVLSKDILRSSTPRKFLIRQNMGMGDMLYSWYTRHTGSQCIQRDCRAAESEGVMLTITFFSLLWYASWHQMWLLSPCHLKGSTWLGSRETIAQQKLIQWALYSIEHNTAYYVTALNGMLW